MDREALKELLKDKPEFLNTSDLVEVGLFPSKHAVHQAKNQGYGPPSIRMSVRKLRYPKNVLIDWLLKMERPDDKNE